MKATMIIMKPSSGPLSALLYGPLEIDMIYIEGCDKPGFYKKEIVHDYLLDHPGSIYVDIPPFPVLLPATSANGEKYVRSESNDTTEDNLLKLPRK